MLYIYDDLIVTMITLPYLIMIMITTVVGVVDVVIMITTVVGVVGLDPTALWGGIITQRQFFFSGVSGGRGGPGSEGASVGRQYYP